MLDVPPVNDPAARLSPVNVTFETATPPPASDCASVVAVPPLVRSVALTPLARLAVAGPRARPVVSATVAMRRVRRCRPGIFFGPFLPPGTAAGCQPNQIPCWRVKHSAQDERINPGVSPA